MRVVGADEARALDARTIAAGTPGIVLMERAARAMAREVLRAVAARPERAGRVVVLAGTGNNGGDGFEVARLLRARMPVETLLLGDEARLGGDAAATHARLAGDGGIVVRVRGRGDLEPLRSATLVVDALYGTGLSRPIGEGLAADAVLLLRGAGAFVAAVDIPSGLAAGSPAVWEPHVVADLTVTFGLPKLAHVHLPAAAECGRVVVADIGLVEGGEAGGGGVVAVAARDVAGLFPHRAAASHKGTFGRVGILGGSPGMAGAPALAARAALRAGAGLVTVLAPDEVRPVVHAICPEATTLPVSGDLARFDALAVGPGLGTGEGAAGVLRRALEAPLPAVFDADALNLTDGRPERFASRRAPTLLTPHPGEAARLLGRAIGEVQADRLEAARALARRAGCPVILKGFRSVVCGGDGRVELVLAGNPGMASGGSGDVLTGLAGAFLARGMPALEAARAAAWLHGAAGDLVREARGEESLIAGDLVEALGDAFQLLREAVLP